MDQAIQTMIENLKKNTGKSLEQWIEIVNQKNFAKHGEIMKFLKEEHSFTHGFANFVALRARDTNADSMNNVDTVVERQYKGKEHLMLIYETLLAEILKFGNDIEVAPKNAYVSLRRKKQFAILQPATKTRFEIGINLKGQEGQGILEPITAANAMCSHKINLSSKDDISKEVLQWIKKAYQNAG